MGFQPSWLSAASSFSVLEKSVIQQALFQFDSVVDQCLINSLLDDTPYIVIHQNEVGAIQWRHIRSNEKVLSVSGRTSSRARCVVAMTKLRPNYAKTFV